MSSRKGVHVLQEVLDNLKLHLAVESERIDNYCRLVEDLQTEFLQEREDQESSNGEGSAESGDSGNPDEGALVGRSPDGRTSRTSQDTVYHEVPLFRGMGSYDEIRRRLVHERRRDYQDFLTMEAERGRSKSSVRRLDEVEQASNVSENRPPFFRSQSSMPVRRVVPRAFEDKDLTRKKHEEFARYRQELADQIKLKKSLQEQEERKQAEQDEKWNRRVEDQRRKIREEYENEMAKMKCKSLSQPDLSSIGIKKTGHISKRERKPFTRVRSPSYVQIKDVIRRQKTQTHTIEIDSFPQETAPKRTVAKHASTAPSSPKNVKPLPAPRSSKTGPSKSHEKSPARSSAVPSLHDARKKIQDNHQKLLVKMASLKFSGLP